MQMFACPECGRAVFFENLTCVCGLKLAFDPVTNAFTALANPCANRQSIACNWGADAGGEPQAHCHSCAMTTVIPDLGVLENIDHWRDTEAAKRWTLANLARWGWLTPSDGGPLPVFHLMSEATVVGRAPISMGHAEGVVTINVSEAEPALRIRRRDAFNEPLRTLLGHYRHELGHFLFLERLSQEPEFLTGFRALFGDERADYKQALESYYGSGPADGWPSSHITGYAASHPHEDWAETFAHLVHLTDISDSFVQMSMQSRDLPEPDFDPYACREAEKLISHATRLSIAINHVNRSMGLPDLYPFVLTPTIRDKLAFVHHWIAGRADGLPAA